MNNVFNCIHHAKIIIKIIDVNNILILFDVDGI